MNISLLLAVLLGPVQERVNDPPPMEGPVQREASVPDLRMQWGDLTLNYTTGYGEAAAGPVLDTDPFVAYAKCHKGPGAVFEVEFKYCWPGVDTSEHIIWGCFQSHENALDIYLCLKWDEDGDGDVDMRDFAVFQAEGW